MKKSGVLALIGMLICFSLGGCAGSGVGSQYTQEDPLVLKIGVSTAETDPRNIAAEEFAQEITEKTNGLITAQVYPSGELGGDADLIEKLSFDTGKVDIVISDASNFVEFEPKMGISAMPFLFDDFDVAWKFMDSDIEADAESGLLNKNMRVLAHYCNGFRCVTNSNGPIEKPSDMSGLLIRTPENKVIMETMSAMGADPHPLSFAELYDALKHGTYDAQENPIPVIYNNKLYEVQKYLSVTNHIYSGMCFTIRESVWKKLTPEQQKIISDAALSSAESDRQKNKEQTESLIQSLTDEGMKINYPELEPFAKASEGVINKNAEAYGDLLDRTLEFIKNN